MSDSSIPVGSTGKSLQTFANDLGAGLVHAEALALVDQFGVPLRVTRNAICTLENVGAGAYSAGTLTAGSAILTGRLLALRIYASGADATFNINGGDTMTARDGVGFDWTPKTDWTDAELVWVSGTFDYFAEVTA